MFAIYNKVTRGSLIIIFCIYILYLYIFIKFFAFLVVFIPFFLFNLPTIYLTLVITLLLLLLQLCLLILPLQVLLRSGIQGWMDGLPLFITLSDKKAVSIMFITITVTGILEKSSGRESKKGIQAAWSTPIYHVK